MLFDILLVFAAVFVGLVGLICLFLVGDWLWWC